MSYAYPDACEMQVHLHVLMQVLMLKMAHMHSSNKMPFLQTTSLQLTQCKWLTNAVALWHVSAAVLQQPVIC